MNADLGGKGKRGRVELRDQVKMAGGWAEMVG
mgnify:CR=1 FL=1